MVRIDVTLVCVFLPLILGAPTDDAIKQQISSGLLRNDEAYWNMMNNPDRGNYYYEPSPQSFDMQSRAIDSLGGGNILRRAMDSLSLRSLNGLGSAGEWGNSKSNSWRFGSLQQPNSRFSLKRGSGLDSLGGGNILRRVNENEEANAAVINCLHSLIESASVGAGAGNSNSNPGKRAIDSLGHGNILKRSVTSSSSGSETKN